MLGLLFPLEDDWHDWLLLRWWWKRSCVKREGRWRQVIPNEGLLRHHRLAQLVNSLFVKGIGHEQIRGVRLPRSLVDHLRPGFANLRQRRLICLLGRIVNFQNGIYNILSFSRRLAQLSTCLKNWSRFLCSYLLNLRWTFHDRSWLSLGDTLLNRRLPY